MDRNQACFVPAMTINRWLAVRLEFLGSCLMFSTALVSVAALIISNSVDAGLVGLLMSYTISVTGTLVSWTVGLVFRGGDILLLMMFPFIELACAKRLRGRAEHCLCRACAWVCQLGL